MNIDPFNQAFKAAGEKVLGFKKRKREEWIQGETWEKIKTRRVVKQRMNSTQSERVRDQLRRKHSELDHEEKKMTNLDKKKFVERLAEEAEKGSGRQDLKTLYRINIMLNKGFKNNDISVKDMDGNVLSKEAEKLAHWKVHCGSILNRPEPEQVAEIPPAVEELDICIDPPTMEEGKAAIKAMKSGKAGGADGITAEMLKAEETETPRLLMCIFREIWESETIPEAWKIGLIVKLPKKGNSSIPVN